MITTEKVLEERNSVPLLQTSYEKISEESLQQVWSADAWQRESTDWFKKQAIFQNIAERHLNIIRILNSFKSLIN